MEVVKYLPAFGAAAFAAFAAWTAIKPKYKIIDVRDKFNPNGKYAKRSLSQITDICVHHTAGFNYDLERLVTDHCIVRGWPRPGYTFFITEDDKILQINDLQDISYHNGVDNTHSLGIGVSGNYSEEEMPPEKYKRLAWLIEQIKKGNIHKDLKPKTLSGHREYKPTECPGKLFSMDGLRYQTGYPARYASQDYIPITAANKSAPIYGSTPSGTDVSFEGSTTLIDRSGIPREYKYKPYQSDN